jgi:hypothetical protein
MESRKSWGNKLFEDDDVANGMSMRSRSASTRPEDWNCNGRTEDCFMFLCLRSPICAGEPDLCLGPNIGSSQVLWLTISRDALRGPGEFGTQVVPVRAKPRPSPSPNNVRVQSDSGHVQ